MINIKSAAFKSMFREYDLRGHVSSDELNIDSVRVIANSFGTLLKRRKISNVVIGHDNRPDSPAFKDAAVSGLRSAGCDVVDIGLTISPALYFSQHFLNIPGGLMITASHNPSDWCGMKMAQGFSQTLGPSEMKELYELVTTGEISEPIGGYKQQNTRNAYISRITEGVKLDKSIRVAVDCANGAAGVFAYEALHQLGCLTFQLYCDPDDTYPQYFPNPSDLKARKRLKEIITHPYIKADVGLAFDGDGDRLGVMDENGNDVWSDKVLILLSRQLLQRKNNATIVYDVKCTTGLETEIKSLGGNPVMWKTGHSHIKAKLQELNAELAGERSGHIFYQEGYLGYDDALYAGIKLLEIIASEDKKFSGMLLTLPQYHTSPEIAAFCSDEHKYKTVEKIVTSFKQDYGDKVIDINGARVDFGDGWGLVRASSNMPELVIIFEATTRARLLEIRSIFKSKLSEHKEIDHNWRNDFIEQE